MNVVDYVKEEVERQGHSTETVDGIERVVWMLNAWKWAISQEQFYGRYPSLEDVATLGKLVELEKNKHGIRKCGVRVGSRICPTPGRLLDMLEDLFKRRDSLKPLEFYKSFEEIHPFVDGNGRTGKILLNWLNGTLLDPIFPPNDFWGQEIRNP